MNLKNDSLVLLGALIGGLPGYVVFKWLLGQGFYGLMLPGGLLGMGAGFFKTNTKAVAVVCGFMALLLGLVAEWSSFPFKVDDSLGYFLAHVHELQPATMIMIAIGAAIGFWIPFRRSQDEITQVLKF